MGQENTHTLIATPQLDWLSLLYAHLWKNGFAPLTIAPTGASALDLFCQSRPRLALVDMNLPDFCAISLCEALLQAEPTAKLVLVTDSEVEPPVTALYAGVSACVYRDLPLAAWPGLLAYVLNGGIAFGQRLAQSALRHVLAQQQSLISLGALQINLNHRTVFYAGRRVGLTPREFTLLACLARHLDCVVTTDQLLNEAWGYDSNFGTPAQIRLYIARLRRKLLEDAHVPDFILTERGIGYRLHSQRLQRAEEPAQFSLPTGKNLQPFQAHSAS